MKTILLTRQSAFQVYLANQLASSGHCDQVFIERGDSFAGESPFNSIKDIESKIQKGAKLIFKDPENLVHHIINRVNYKKYYGSQAAANSRILKAGYQKWSNRLLIKEVQNLNHSSNVQKIHEEKPDLVFVFGTGLLKEQLFSPLKCPVINLHWGWSPDYRGEGIISALAHGGPKDLGVTVHLIDAGSDSGKIIFQARPEIDINDNFYTIGLKLTIIGAELFEKCAQIVESGGNLPVRRQDLAQGKLYSQKVMRENPQWVRVAWNNLKGKL